MVDLTGGSCIGKNPAYWDTVTRKGHTSRIGSVRIEGVKLPRMKQIGYAKTICATCPVRALCLQQGQYEEEGIWGGTLPDERVLVLPTADRWGD